MKHPAHITIRGKRWKLIFCRIRNSLNAWGICDPPTNKAKAIKIDSRIKGEHKLEVLIHEMLHAASWDLDESLVEEFAKDAARVLTQCGYKEAE